MTSIHQTPAQAYRAQSPAEIAHASTSTSASNGNGNNNANGTTLPAPLKVEQNTVTLSEEGKALLSALQEIDKESKLAAEQNRTVTDKVESFAHGALGMDHPDSLEEEQDDSYSAGQYLSAAASIGGVLLALI